MQPVMRRQVGIGAVLLFVALVALAVSAAERSSSAPRLSAPDWSAVDAYIESRREAARIPGIALAVVHEDKIVYLRGYGAADSTGRPVTPQTPFVLGSVSKAFTALAVMQLVEAGKIGLDEPVFHYLPWFRVADESASRAITVRQLLNQTSGLSMYAGRRLLADFDASDEALERHVRALADVRLQSPPGSQYEYSNANYTTAGLIVQTVSGLSYEEYIHREIFDPLEMHHSYSRQDEAERGGLAEGHRMLFGRPVSAAHLPFVRGETPAAYLCSSAEDMGHWLIAHLNGGQFKGHSVLSSEGIATLHTPPAGGSYAMGWMRSSVGDLSVLMHQGEVPNFRAQTLLAPSERLGVVTLMNVNTYLDQERLTGLPNGVVSILIGKTPPEPPRRGVVPLVYSAVLMVLVAQTVSLWWGIRTVGRWKNRARIPSSGFIRGACLFVPLILDLILILSAFVLVPQLFKISLSAMLLYQPDVGWSSVGLAIFAAIWGSIRTVLLLWRLRRGAFSELDGAA